MYHYVYRITNIKNAKYYYGTRSSKCLPKEDLGIKYFSSSNDKEFIQDQTSNPQDYKYKIVRIYSTRKEALKLEIELHNKFDVGINESFYNRTKQTSTGWDNSGISPSIETRQKISNSLKGHKHSKETKEKLSIINKNRSYKWQMKISNSNKGKTRSDESKQKMSIAHIGMKYSDETNKKKGRSGESNGMYGKTHSDLAKEKMSKVHKGKIISDDQKLKISKSLTGITKNMKLFTCPHCKKEGKGGNMTRYHFDNCKYKYE